MRTRLLAGTLLVSLVGALSLAPGAQARTPARHRLLQLAGPDQSYNWSGYNEGRLDHGNPLYTSVAADWVVPTAKQHKPGEAEFSSTWAGIGGGKLCGTCVETDNTLIQAGTAQEVDLQGNATYSAWWETVPVPSVTVDLPVGAGDRIHVDIQELLPATNLWSIAITNVTRHQTSSVTVPYASTRGSVEWIEETPLVLDPAGTGFSAMPTLSKVAIDNVRVNGAKPRLSTGEAIQLVDPQGNVLATPSAPDADLDGYADCVFSKRCTPPAS